MKLVSSRGRRAGGPLPTLSLIERAAVLRQLARAVLAWQRHDTRYPSPVPDDPRFMDARSAAALIRDRDVVACSGLGGNQRASILYWAIREAFEETGHPADLTVINLGGHGGRGRAPGTLEELGRPGLCTRLITGHFETFHAMLDLAARGRCALQCIPQGTLALLLDGLGRGETSLLSETGVGTFIDPRVGPGSPVAGTSDEQLVAAAGRQLRYHVPPVDVAIFNAPAADRHGNIYVRHCSMIGETGEIARAARRNGGRVIANVGRLVPHDAARVYLPADMVDAVVVYPDAEQTSAVFHREPWLAVTTDADGDIGAALARVRFVNRVVGLTARRTAVDAALARLAAATLCAVSEPGARVNIGTGLPEEIPAVVFGAGGLARVTFLVESGPVGGVPASGVYFGASIAPREIVSSAEMFRLCYERLDVTCLGALQVDAAGNVNVSQRGEGPRHFVGPGGFIDLSTAAHTVLFVCHWATHGAIDLERGRLRITRRGTPKFVAQVDQITFNGERALAAGKRVFWATPVGLMRLTRRGVELVAVLPGIDPQRDVVEGSRGVVRLPPGDAVRTLPAALLTGDALSLHDGGPLRGWL
ncbi:MAG: malonate decarboxylase subunit alpha [Candidatus Binatia bacterium]